MQFSKKLIGGALSLPLMFNEKFRNKIIYNNANIKNECHEGHSHMEHHMEEEAEALERIFTEQGSLMNPHEMLD